MSTPPEAFSLDAMAQTVAAAAPPLNEYQRALIVHLFASVRHTPSGMSTGAKPVTPANGARG